MFYQDWVRAQLANKFRQVAELMEMNDSWSPPAIGRLKCNVDASLNHIQNCTVFGLCIRASYCCQN